MRAHLSYTITFLVHYVPLAALLIAVLAPISVQAAELAQRSVQLETSTPSASNSHTFDFSLPGATTLGSIKFEYCSNSPFLNETCDPPDGLSLDDATLASQTGETGFAVTSQSANEITIARPPQGAFSGPVQYVFDGVINPSTPGTSTYVRISTYAVTDATGSPVDYGAVVFSTSGSVGVDVFVPPFLIFCVGVEVQNNCSSYSGDFSDLGVLSENRTATATTQLAAATNDPEGYVVFSLGNTMTSGNNVIPASTSPSISLPGTSQFGINLRNNSVPDVGRNGQGSGSATPHSNYNIVNRYMFEHGDSIVSSGQSTDFNTHTVSYIVNVSPEQAPGIYNTTITFSAIANF